MGVGGWWWWCVVDSFALLSHLWKWLQTFRGSDNMIKRNLPFCLLCSIWKNIFIFFRIVKEVFLTAKVANALVWTRWMSMTGLERELVGQSQRGGQDLQNNQQWNIFWIKLMIFFLWTFLPPCYLYRATMHCDGVWFVTMYYNIRKHLISRQKFYRIKSFDMVFF